MPLLKINCEICMNPKGMKTSGASADNSAKLCTDRPATVEEVTSLVNVTNWRSSLGWDESYEPLPVWCSHKICSQTRTELSFLRTEESKQRYQNKLHKSRALTAEGTKATRPALGPVTLPTTWCLLPVFILLHISPEKSLPIGTQVRIWCDTPNTCRCPEKRVLPFQIRQTEPSNLATPLRWQSLGSAASDELGKTLQEHKASSYGPKTIA